MTQHPAEKERLTGEDLLAMGDMGPCELIDGKLVQMVPTGGEHARIESALGLELGLWARERGKYLDARQSAPVLGCRRGGAASGTPSSGNAQPNPRGTGGKWGALYGGSGRFGADRRLFSRGRPEGRHIVERLEHRLSRYLFRGLRRG